MHGQASASMFRINDLPHLYLWPSFCPKATHPGKAVYIHSLSIFQSPYSFQHTWTWLRQPLLHLKISHQGPQSSLAAKTIEYTEQCQTSMSVIHVKLLEYFCTSFIKSCPLNSPNTSSLLTLGPSPLAPHHLVTKGLMPGIIARFSLPNSHTRLISIVMGLCPTHISC